VKISVIIPVYNAAQYLPKAVASALEQPEVAEVILIEDGSKDNSLDICESLKRRHKSIRLLRHPGGINCGASASRNMGILHALEPLIAFLDADDYYLEKRFEGDLEIITSDTSIDGVYNAIGTEFYNEAGRAWYTERGFTEQHLTTMTDRVRPEDLFDQIAPIGQKGYFSGDGLVVKRCVFDKTGLFDCELAIGEDTLLWLKMSLVCRLSPGELTRPVAIRGVHGNNHISDTARRDSLRALMFEKLYTWSREQNISRARLERVWSKYYYSSTTQPGANGLLQVLTGISKYPEQLSYRFFWSRLAEKFRRGKTE
jgi:glycosyltransferase involved in cell wall biosynthesis